MICHLSQRDIFTHLSRRKGCSGHVFEQLVAESTPVAINVRTPTKERLLKRAIPHIPWPVVHPFPSLVPNPTQKPPKMNPMLHIIISVCIVREKNIK